MRQAGLAKARNGAVASAVPSAALNASRQARFDWPWRKRPRFDWCGNGPRFGAAGGEVYSRSGKPGEICVDILTFELLQKRFGGKKQIFGMQSQERSSMLP